MLGKLLEQSRLQLAMISPLFNQLYTVIFGHSLHWPLLPPVPTALSMVYTRGRRRVAAPQDQQDQSLLRVGAFLVDTVIR